MGFKMKTLFFLFSLFFSSFIFGNTCKIIDEEAHRIGIHLYPITSFFTQTDNNKIFFYSVPDEKCKNNEFLINKQQVIAYIEYDDFYFVMYLGLDGKDIEGWIKKDNLIPTGYSINSQ